MKQQDALYPLTFELEIPRQNAGYQGGKRRNRCYGNVALSCLGEAAVVRCPVYQTKNNGIDVERDGERDQPDMLRVLSQNCCLPIERVCHGTSKDPRVS
jgi:hypothetical protein